MISEEENKKEKELFLKNYFPCFTPYLSLEKLEQKIPSYRYLNDELKKLEQTSPESTIKHVMGKKKLLISKNAKQLCRDGIPLKHMRNILLKMFNVNFSKEDFENKRKEVLKGREFSDMGDLLPTFCRTNFTFSLPERKRSRSFKRSLMAFKWSFTKIRILSCFNWYLLDFIIIFEQRRNL